MAITVSGLASLFIWPLPAPIAGTAFGLAFVGGFLSRIPITPVRVVAWFALMFGMGAFAAAQQLDPGLRWPVFQPLIVMTSGICAGILAAIWLINWLTRSTSVPQSVRGAVDALTYDEDGDRFPSIRGRSGPERTPVSFLS